jgi:hypothetical protein
MSAPDQLGARLRGRSVELADHREGERGAVVGEVGLEVEVTAVPSALPIDLFDAD